MIPATISFCFVLFSEDRFRIRATIVLVLDAKSYVGLGMRDNIYGPGTAKPALWPKIQNSLFIRFLCYRTYSTRKTLEKGPKKCFEFFLAYVT